MIMAPSPIQYLTLADLCERWHVKPPQIAAVALEGKLRLSIPVPGVYAEIGYYEDFGDGDWQRIPEGRRHITGIFNLFPRDAWALIKNKTVLITDLSAEGDGYIDLEAADREPEFHASADDILIRRDEVERFEAESVPAVQAVMPEPAGRAGPGVSPKFDWDGFWVEVCRRVHDDGIPTTQAEMVRAMQDWFDTQGTTAPDQSTIKKKVSRLWKALHPSRTNGRGVARVTEVAT